MSFFFGRRHSISQQTPPEGDGLPQHERCRRASVPNISVSDRSNPTAHTRGVIHEIFHKHRPESDSHAAAAFQPPEPPSGSAQPPHEKSDSHARHDSGSHDSTDEHREKPIRSHRPHHEPEPSPQNQLTKRDVETIFSGAPYFLLEKGKHGLWYPQIIFPFDDHEPTIQSLGDRRPLPHASYTLCTLHAHLPVPDDWVVEGELPVHLGSWKRADAPKRATFDVGVLEVPNMLSINGKDPGTIGFRHFLELPVADAALYIAPEKARPCSDLQHLSTLPATEVYELMGHYNDPYAQCSDGTIHDRKKMLCEGPGAWKRIGVRDVDLRTLVERLQKLKDLRYEILHGDVPKTLLDTESIRELYNGLFNRFLYPPVRFLLLDAHDPHCLKAQIKALTVVLSTPGAWLDFSMIDWRLHIGQLLWESPPHVDGDFLDPSKSEKPRLQATLERKWFLVQMVLAAELLLRLDATVRVGMLQNSREIDVSIRDVYDFDRLRSGKLNWDLVAVRRFMDSFTFTYDPVEPGCPPTSPSKLEDRHHHRSFLETLTHHRSPSPSAHHNESAWKCHLVPNHVDQQLKGLFVFADSLGWPRMDELKTALRSRLEGPGSEQTIREAYTTPVRNTLPTGYTAPELRKEMYGRSLSRRLLLLRPRDRTQPLDIGGWVTRTWLAGFVIPGESISHLLMATLLENDADAMAVLGPVVNLYGGFAYNGKTWWSKKGIVGRVLASKEGTKVCLAWLGSSVVPKDSQTEQPLDNTWFEVNVKEPPRQPGKPRIKHGNRLSFDSTPLGLGDLTSGAFLMPVDGPTESWSKLRIDFEDLAFSIDKTGAPADALNHHLTVAEQAVVNFTLTSDTDGVGPTTVSFPLTYNVRFVSSHECRPPGGLISYHNSASATDSGRSSSTSSYVSHRHHRLPGHPLHRSYGYQWVPLETLADSRAPADGNNGGLPKGDILVLDARSSHDKETFARAWCASVGHHAIVGKVGRTCLACCIREARALQVKVVIRIGEGFSTPASSVHVLYGGE
ncbi:hypothetical protein BO70DRAFT_290472 [Aspergillus heteromorphus CBS 117.55]|uniref:Uncharacterized protein n=1 Tax=Aspergillus heteromorphus CBS 117.55 TaxID=1448321 RepID=A0A317WH78_9EURO|nr:uncharacterized protein BO70DRAFT_290472 [Aspergillus heteromorphus CBS 117.55]PWY83550.1 hypothetical protein BO70DRAFT_290472 [Aspergillus heteromorphus CBS 117.55]